MKHPNRDSDIDVRSIRLGPDLAEIPERLLLAHARGEVLFLAGAGVSRPAGLPDFSGLVQAVYKDLDPPVYDVISNLLSNPPPTTDKRRPLFKPPDVSEILLGVYRLPPNPPSTPHERRERYPSDLSDYQVAEMERFFSEDYDVVLGMLERRMDGQSHDASQVVRQAVAEALRKPDVRPAPIHRYLMRLADRGGAMAIVTTNFDRLLEAAARELGKSLQTYALGGIPRPSRGDDFAGVFHLHGALDRDPERYSDLVVTDRDFGEFYLRRRIAPDFIYDATRLFHLVLVGYSANDPPMRYLLNAIAGDAARYPDLKERFAFVDTRDPVVLADWKGRGITPIPYDPADNHVALSGTLECWADLSAIDGEAGLVDKEIRRIVRTERGNAGDADRDLFDHLIRRADPNERVRLSKLASRHKADSRLAGRHHHGCGGVEPGRFRWIGVGTASAREGVPGGAARGTGHHRLGAEDRSR